MSRTLKRILGSGAGGAWVLDTDEFLGTPHAIPLQEDLDILMAACVSRDVWIAGSDQDGIDASASGDQLLLNAFPPSKTDNSGNQLTNFSDPSFGATLVCEFIFALRASNAAITLTPKLKYGAAIGSISSVATISGEAACSATNSDYSGTDQIQSVLATMPTGIQLWLPYVTVGGSPAAGYQFWASVRRNIYVVLP